MFYRTEMILIKYRSKQEYLLNQKKKLEYLYLLTVMFIVMTTN